MLFDTSGSCFRWPSMHLRGCGFRSRLGARLDSQGWRDEITITSSSITRYPPEIERWNRAIQARWWKYLACEFPTLPITKIRGSQTDWKLRAQRELGKMDRNGHYTRLGSRRRIQEIVLNQSIWWNSSPDCKSFHIGRFKILFFKRLLFALDFLYRQDENDLVLSLCIFCPSHICLRSSRCLWANVVLVSLPVRAAVCWWGRSKNCYQMQVVLFRPIHYIPGKASGAANGQV